MTPPVLSVGLARVHDAAEIARMSRDLIENGLPWAWRPERVAASVRSSQANVVVARARGRMVGFGIMRYGDDQAHLDLLAVDAEFRRAGLGCLLVGWLEKPAVVGGIASVLLEVREQNRDAQAFYERLGYRRLARLADYYQGREAAIRMTRQLGSAQQAVD